MAVFKLTQFSNGRRRQHTRVFKWDRLRVHSLHVLCVRRRYCGRPPVDTVPPCDGLCFADLTCALCTVSLARAETSGRVSILSVNRFRNVNRPVSVVFIWLSCVPSGGGAHVFSPYRSKNDRELTSSYGQRDHPTCLSIDRPFVHRSVKWHGCRRPIKKLRTLKITAESAKLCDI